MKCRFCGCTFERACPAGCGWADETDLCTVCAAFMAHLRDYTESANRVTAVSLKRMLDEVTAQGYKDSPRARAQQDVAALFERGQPVAFGKDAVIYGAPAKAKP